jgi:anti-sigma B factor antagonist
MLVTERKKDGIKFLELHGRIDGNTGEFEKELTDMVVGETRIVVDCGGLNFINSSGLRIFLSAVKTVSNNDGKIVLCNLTQNISDIFKISGFTKIFKIYKNLDEALKNI